MAKKNSKNAKTKNNRRQRRPRATTIAGLNQRVQNHVNMVMDPCGAVLGTTAYRGSDGIVTKFRINYTGNTTPTTSNYVLCYYPGYNTIWAQQILTGDENIGLAFSATNAGPGQAFLLATAEAQRAVGACLKFSYTGTELNREGTVYSGVLPLAACSGASFNQLAVLLQESMRMPDKEIEIKWIPAPAEENYWGTGPTAPEDGAGRNVVVILVKGSLATNTTFRYSANLIAEWKPKYGAGMQTPTPNTPDVPAGLESVRTVLAGKGDWWTAASSLAGHAVVAGRRISEVVS